MVPLILQMRKEAATEQGLNIIQDLRETARQITVLDFERSVLNACIHEEAV